MVTFSVSPAVGRPPAVGQPLAAHSHGLLVSYRCILIQLQTRAPSFSRSLRKGRETMNSNPPFSRFRLAHRLHTRGASVKLTNDGDSFSDSGSRAGRRLPLVCAAGGRHARPARLGAQH